MADRPGFDPRLRWLSLLFIGFTIVMIVRFAGLSTSGARLEKPSFTAKGPLGAKVFPADWKLTDLSGKPFSLESIRGKPIFLNIWATWCGPCRAEMPAIANLARNRRVKDYVFLCVVVQSDLSEAKRYVEENHFPMTFAAAESVPAVFDTEGFPSTFILDRSGAVVFSHVGAASWDDPDVVDRLEKSARRSDRPDSRP